LTRKLTTILVISFVTVNALFLFAVSFMSYRVFFDFTSEEISEARLTLLNESTEKLSNFNTSVSEAGIFIAANSTVIEMFSEGVEDAYDAITEQRELTDLANAVESLKRGVYSIEVYTDRYKDYPMITDTSVHSMSYMESQPWFGLFDLMDNGWLPKHTSPLNDEEMISYVHRLINHRGNTVGYIKVNVLADTFFEYVAEEQSLDTNEETLILMDSGGRIITQTDSSSTIMSELSERHPSGPYQRLIEPYGQLANHHQVINHGNKIYLMLISKANYERWQLVHLIPVDSLYAKTRELGRFVMLLGLGGLLLSVPMVYWVGRRILVPIRKMIHGMRQVEKGRFDVRMDPHYIEEYDILAKNFNHMNSELERSMRELKSENRARRDAELKMLQSQIMPHFLYNTLDIIHWKAMDRQAEDISVMVNQLSKMFRIGLSGGQKFITLRDELEHARCFINIQRARSNQDMDYEVKVPAGMKDFYVPKIILQPFIENSLKHGYTNGIHEKIRIQVEAENLYDQLHIRITDYGSGLPEGWVLEETTGIGVKNVQERIWMYCGKSYGIELANHEQGGTRVRIILPVIENEAALQDWLIKGQDWLDV
jgi:two-component system sensor histidine kinase YesM